MRSVKEETSMIRPTINRVLRAPDEYMTSLVANDLINARPWKYIRPRNVKVYSKNALKIAALLMGQVRVKKDNAFCMFSVTASERYRKLGEKEPPKHLTIVNLLDELLIMSMWMFDRHGVESGRNTWHHVRMLDEAQFDPESGLIYLKLSDQLRPYALGLQNNYSTLYIRSILKLESPYDICMYQYLRQFALLKRKVHRASVRQVLDVMFIGNDYVWSVFERDNLKPTLERISKLTELTAKHKAVREGRTDRKRGIVDEIIFYVREEKSPGILEGAVVSKENKLSVSGVISGEKWTLEEIEPEEEVIEEQFTIDEYADQ